VAKPERSLPPASAWCLAAVDATLSKAVGADEGVPIRAIAEVIGRHLDLRVASIAPGDAGEQFAWLAGVLETDMSASSAVTRELLGWNRTQPGLIEDLDQGHDFDQARAAAA
jgi:hypothetical protein